jgi:hypothetical protein
MRKLSCLQADSSSISVKYLALFVFSKFLSTINANNISGYCHHAFLEF